jgi:hypothetical protein
VRNAVANAVPGEDADADLPVTSMVAVSVEGVVCTEIYLYPPILLPATMCAGNAHLCCRLCGNRSRLAEDIRGILVKSDRGVGARCNLVNRCPKELEVEALSLSSGKQFLTARLHAQITCSDQPREG